MLKLLKKYGFTKTGVREYIKFNYTAIVFRDELAVNITYYTPGLHRMIWSHTYYTKEDFEKYLKENHKEDIGLKKITKKGSNYLF